MRANVRMHLINGEVVDGASEESTQEELEYAKKATSDLVMSTGGWMIHTELPNGNWACFPKQSVLYVEYVIDGGLRH